MTTRSAFSSTVFLLTLVTAAPAAPVTDLADAPQKTPLEAVRDFHGHSDPWALLGARMGDYAMKELGVQKKFGMLVIVEYDPRLPMTGVVDGLQLATGATYGQQAITLIMSNKLRVQIIDTTDHRGLTFRLTNSFRNTYYQWKSAGYGLEKQTALLAALADNEIFSVEEVPDR